jgi:hypothetical protein
VTPGDIVDLHLAAIIKVRMTTSVVTVIENMVISPEMRLLSMSELLLEWNLRLHSSSLDFTAVSFNEDATPTRSVLAICIALSRLPSLCGTSFEPH